MSLGMLDIADWKANINPKNTKTQNRPPFNPTLLFNGSNAVTNKLIENNLNNIDCQPSTTTPSSNSYR
jgi:hypothetical protein